MQLPVAMRMKCTDVFLQASLKEEAERPMSEPVPSEAEPAAEPDPFNLDALIPESQR